MVYYFHFISVGGAWGVGLMVIMGLNSCNWHRSVPSLESNPLSFWGLLPSPGLYPPTTRFPYKSWLAGPLASLLAPNHPSPHHPHVPSSSKSSFSHDIFVLQNHNYSPTSAHPRFICLTTRGTSAWSYSFSPLLSSNTIVISQAHLLGSINRYINPLS